MSSREFWAAEAAKMRDTSALFDMSHLAPDTFDNKNTSEKLLGNKYGAKSTIEVYYANDTKAGMSGAFELKDDLKKVVAHAANILKKGIGGNIRFIPISVSKAKEYTMGSERVAFLAFISQFNKDIGNSRPISKNARTGVYDVDTNTDSPEKTWLSWVDYGHIKQNKNEFPDPVYATGYIMAHEILHQLLCFSALLLDKVTVRNDHINIPNNLNMDAKEIQPGELKQGCSHETVLKEHKEQIKRYFKYLKEL